MSNITTTTAAVFLPQLWSVETLRATERALVMAGLVKRYDALVKGKGQIINVPNISNFSTARAKSAGSDVTNDATTETSTTITIDQHYYVAFMVEDIVAVQSNYDLTKDLGSFISNNETKWLCIN